MPQVQSGIKAPITLALSTVKNKYLEDDTRSIKSCGKNLSIRDEAKMAIKKTGRISARR